MSHRRLALRLAAGFAALAAAEPALAQAAAGVGPDVARTALILTLLAVVPAILVSMTSFIRIVVVLAMVRHAFGMPETPPNAVLVSLSLFLTAFTMSPVLTELNRDTVQPLLAGRIGVERAMETGSAPLRKFMLTQTRDADIESIYAISNTPLPERPDQVEILKLAPAFILNELRVSFTIGFVVLLPFLLIDLVVSSILLSLGMMMVPPTTISLPIKLLMFVLIDGWKLVLEGVLGSFG
ncbi:MAG: flagellar biosynthesis protein FliP [Sphingomonadales bacterium]|jgi:flagellar biosynthetic protein FliP|nr:flagellar biosynthesis protein FliP [Sphingomonadales bacterium]